MFPVTVYVDNPANSMFVFPYNISLFITFLFDFSTRVGNCNPEVEE